jgi:hypothetical protein
MNAKEAKLAAQKKAAEIKKKKEDDERREAEQSAKKWKEARAEWFKSELAGIERHIADAVEKGETRTHVWLASSDEPERAAEKAFWERFAYKPELKKVISHFEDLGYQIAFGVKPHEHVDLSDLNPRDNYYTYETILEISW